ncbi:MAG: LPS assembly lipoprotein LptE [Pseudomonadota bacterium]
MPSYLVSIAIETQDTRSDLYLALERELLARGVAIDPLATSRLAISDEATGQRVLSVSVRNIPREYEVFYTLSYRFTHNGEELLSRPGLTLTRDYTWSEFEVLGKVQEEQLLRDLIVDDLVDVILRQLASLES